MTATKLTQSLRLAPSHDENATSVAIVSVHRIHQLDPAWPFSVWSSRRLMRLGRLGCKRVGNRYFVTRAHLEAFVRDDKAA